MALVCQNRLRSCEIPYGMELWLQNWDFSRFGVSQPFRSCEMRAPVLRSGTRVPKSVSQQRKFSQESIELRNDFAKDGRFRRDTLIPQRLLLGCETVSRGSANFAEAAKSRRPLFLPCFCSERLPFNFFAIPPDFDQPKIYFTSKQIRIKALKSKLKQVKK